MVVSPSTMAAVRQSGAVPNAEYLLSAEGVAFAARALLPAPLDRHLEGHGGVEEHRDQDVVLRDVVEPGQLLGRQRATLLDLLVGRLAVEQDVEGELERAGILAADDLGQLAQGNFAHGQISM